jgi:hypothetical protein
LCSASRVEESKRVEADDWNVYAATGTALHKIVEIAVDEGLSDQQLFDEFTGVIMERVEITREHIAGKIIPALDYLEMSGIVDCTLRLESRVEFAPEGHKLFPHIPGAFGGTDVAFKQPVTNGRAGVLDYKFGDGDIISPSDNDQCRFYLVSQIACGYLPVQETYEAHIFQPSTKLRVEEYGSVAHYTLDDLVYFAEDLADALSSAPEYVTGEHCYRCKGKLTCAAYKSMLTTINDTDVRGLSASQLASYRNLVPALEAFIRDVKDACLRNAQAGIAIPGWKLEASLGDRTWKDEGTALAALGRLGVPADVRVIKTAMSAPKALDYMRGTLLTPPKELSAFEKRHIVRRENGEKLVKARPGEDTATALNKLSVAMRARGY